MVYAGLLFLTYNRLASTPTGLIPQLDRGYFIAAMQLPPGSTLERADRLVRQASDMILATPGVRQLPSPSSASTAPPSPTRPIPA